MIKFLIFLKRLLTAFFVNLVFRPGRFICRFLFYKVLVKLYRLYFSAVKRLGLADKLDGGSFSLFTDRKLIHIAMATLTVFFVIFNLTSKTQAVSPEEMSGQNFLSEIIANEFGQTDQLIEEYFDEEAVITPVQQTYLDNLTAFRAQPAAEMAAPDESSLFSGTGEAGAGNALVRPDLAATTKGIRPRDGIVDYIVQAGDTISTIAAQFGVSVNTILWENELNAYSMIRPGNKLSILPMSGVSYKVGRGDTLAAIASKYGVDAAIIMETNKLASANDLSSGQKLLIPGGRKILYASSRVARNDVSGVSMLKDLFKPENLKTFVSNKLAWPTVGARITQYFSWRHYAIDIANHIGTPIYAADAGEVEVAGWGRGYGNQIVLDHGAGKKSRYGHMSKFLVSKGDTVQKGQAIGLMGSTGYSTGPHLHFEYIINGIKYNPLNYLK